MALAIPIKISSIGAKSWRIPTALTQFQTCVFFMLTSPGLSSSSRGFLASAPFLAGTAESHLSSTPSLGALGQGKSSGSFLSHLASLRGHLLLPFCFLVLSVFLRPPARGQVKIPKPLRDGSSGVYTGRFLRPQRSRIRDLEGTGLSIPKG